MEWLSSFDPLARTSFDYMEELHTLVMGPYFAAIESLDREYDRQIKKIDDVLTRVTRPDVVDDMNSYKIFHLAHHTEQTRAAGNMALVSLVTLFRDTLKKLMRQLADQFPREANKRYRGKHELARIKTELKERFGLDACVQGCPLDFCIPLALARDFIVHESGYASANFASEYPEYVDELGRVRFFESHLLRAVGASGSSITWLSKELGYVRDKAASSIV